MSDPRFVPGESSSQASYAYGDRSCLVAAGGILPTFDGTDAAIGAAVTNIDLTGKVFLVARNRALDSATGDAATAATPRIGFGTDAFDWRTVDSPPYLGLGADSWAFEGTAGGRTWAAGVATAYGQDVDHGELLAVAYDGTNGRAWFGSVDADTGAVTWFGGGDPVASTGHALTVSGSGIRFGITDGSTDHLLGLQLLTAAEADDLGVTVPTGFSYATDGASAGAPDAPAVVGVDHRTSDEMAFVVGWELSGSGVAPEIAEVQVEIDGGAWTHAGIAEPLAQQFTWKTTAAAAVRFRVRFWAGASTSAWTEQAVPIAPTPALAP